MANQGQNTTTFYGYWPQNQAQVENADLTYCCEVHDEFFYVKTTSDIADGDETGAPYLGIDVTDPLRYFLENGEITPNEYDAWRIIKETVPATATAATATATANSTNQQTTRLDFGPGYNSDSGSDSDTNDESLARPATVSYSYGHGYITQIPSKYAQFRGALVYHESWNPTPDPTQDNRYTKLANDGEYRLTRFTQWSSSKPMGRNCRKMLPELSTSFKLKIEWERFLNSSCHSHAHHTRTLQDFWSENAFQIYEALQELNDEQARVRATPNSEWIRSIIPDILPAPEYHTTPFETLENTFETIGRMSRCIAEDFNVESVVEYVEEFMKALYREIEFNALVEEYEYRIGDAEHEKLVKEHEAEKLRETAQESVTSRLTTSAEFDFIAECDDQSRLPWCCGDD
jgi:hypothetical protein